MKKKHSRLRRNKKYRVIFHKEKIEEENMIG